jgi:hypothetical protein
MFRNWTANFDIVEKFLSQGHGRFYNSTLA